MSSSSKNFLSGALILSAAGVLVKIIGAIYKIPLVNLLGEEGMGYYNSAYQIYSLLFVISTAGIPVAISKLVSESIVLKRLHEPKKILRIAVITFSVIGLVGTLALWFGVDLFCNMIKNSNADLSVLAVAPAVFFVSLTASFKGFYQGHKNMKPTAIYQILEALSKLIGLGIVLVMAANGCNARQLAAGAILGVTLGAFLSSLFMFLRFVLGKAERVPSDAEYRPSRSGKEIFKEMIKISIPVTLGSAVTSITSTVDLLVVMRRLQSGAGFSEEMANKLYGAYSGLSTTMFNLPPTVILPIAVSVLPFISAAYAIRDHKTVYGNMHSSFKVASLMAMPCAIGMSFMAEPILWLLFGSQPSAVQIAAPTLRVLAISIMFVPLVSLSNAVLQAVGHTVLPVVAMLTGAVLKIVINFILVGIPSVNINGAPIGTFFCYGSIILINLINIRRTTGFSPDIKEVFLKPLCCSFICGGTAVGVYQLLYRGLHISGSLSTVAALGVAVLAYVVSVLAHRVLNEKDVLLLPKGEKLAGVMKKHRLLKSEETK